MILNSAPNLLNTFIKNVETALFKTRRTKSDLARLMHVRPQAVNQYLGGQNSPKLATVEEIALALNVPAHRLLDPEFGAAAQSQTDSVEAAVARALEKKFPATTAAPRVFYQSAIPEPETPRQKLLAAISELSDSEAETLLPVVQSRLAGKKKPRGKAG